MIEQYWQYLAIGSLVLAGSSIVAWITFWMKIGSRLSAGEQAQVLVTALAPKVQTAESAYQLASAAVAKAELFHQQFNDYKVEAARDFVTSKDLAHAETRMTVAVESMRVEVRGMNERLDRLLEAAMKRVS
jgi:hypothetical protein